VALQVPNQHSSSTTCKSATKEWYYINKINNDLTAIGHWTKTWFVTFSSHKSEFLIISNNIHIEEHPPIYMDGTVLTKVTHHKHVGLQLTEIYRGTNILLPLKTKPARP